MEHVAKGGPYGPLFLWHLRILLEWWFVDLVPDRKAVAAAPICEHQIGQMLI